MIYSNLILDPQSQKQSLSEQFETQCPICFCPYAEPHRPPMMLCIKQHNCCEQCLLKLIKSNTENRKCPTCREKILYSSAEKNRLLIKLIKFSEKLTEKKSKYGKQVQKLKKQVESLKEQHKVSVLMIEQFNEKLYNYQGEIEQLIIQNKALRKANITLQKTNKALEECYKRQYNKPMPNEILKEMQQVEEEQLHENIPTQIIIASYKQQEIKESMALSVEQLECIAEKYVTEKEVENIIKSNFDDRKKQLILNYIFTEMSRFKMLIKYNWPFVTKLELANNSICNKSLKILTAINWPSLTSLSLCNNKIDTLNGWTPWHVSKLSYINLSRNLLKDLPQNFKCLQNLQALLLQSNKFRKISQIVKCLRRLKYLNITDNPLQKAKNSKIMDDLVARKVLFQS